MAETPHLTGTESRNSSGKVILDVNNISLSFGGVKALTGISFDVREHEIRAIIGPNGAGKSSMLNCINGVYTPQQGSITFRGQTFGHMLQVTQEFPQLGVLAMNLVAERGALDELHGDIVHALVLTNLEDLRDVWMTKRRGRLSFLNKAPHPILICGDIGRQNLQRDFAIELCILREEHLAHTARADL